MEAFLKKAKEAARIVATISPEVRTNTLIAMSKAILANSNAILSANKEDYAKAKELKLSEAMLDRLRLDKERIATMAHSINEIAMLKNPLGRILDGWVAESGIKIQKVSIPIGVIGIIYESRPNVTSDTAALCFKSGNICVLKGGKEAQHSNKAIADALQSALKEYNLPCEAISLLPDSSREGVARLVKMNEYVDLIIPRGGESLIKFVSENATIPVIKHDKGICHTYVHECADFEKAAKIIINAKVQRPSACNALETLLVDSGIAKRFLSFVTPKLVEHGVSLRACQKSKPLLESLGIKTLLASEADFDTEYGDYIINIKIVHTIDDAITHITRHGSGHSEAIITEDYAVAERFMDEVDAASIYLNASTRFSDGGEYGFGAEVGISTSKLHARGPMGISELTTYKFKVYGNGEIRK
ncbi:MAG: glutamate-5-semialdehyde dehydrogenase [Wolinella sp.]